MISSLLGKALRTLVDIARLAERFNMGSQSRASLISKDANLVFLFISLPIVEHSSTSDYDVNFDFCVDSVSLATSMSS